MAKKLIFPHDSGYKELLSCNQLFLELLDSFVDQGWVKQIDRDRILLLDKSFIEEEFVRIEADLVYQLQLNGKEVIFYLLMELQSTNCFQMPYRLLQYMAAIWRYYFKSHCVEDKQDFCLPAIVPIVVYNGGDNWTACRSYKEILTQAELFGEYVVDFKYILIDVNLYNEKDLWELANLIDGVFLLDQKVTPEIYQQRMVNLAPILKRYGEPIMKLFLNWFVTVVCRGLSIENKTEIVHKLENLHLEEAENVVSNMAETWRKMYDDALLTGEAKGELKGELKGKLEIARNMLLEGMPIAMVLKVTKLSETQIINLQQELKTVGH